MKKQQRIEREQQLRERYRFLTEGKDDAMRVLINMGKKMGRMRYLMIAFLFVFLFLYHASYHLLLQLKLREKMARAVAYVMVVALLVSSVNLTALAMNQLGGGDEPDVNAVTTEAAEPDTQTDDEDTEVPDTENPDGDTEETTSTEDTENPEDTEADANEIALLSGANDVATYASAGRYQEISINSSSLNGNAVWGLGESFTSSVRLDTYAAFYAKSTSRNSGTGGLPADGSISMGGVPYRCNWTGSSAYDGNDCIRLVGSGSQTMNLGTYGAYENIYVLGTAGEPGTGNYAGFTVTLNYTTGTSESTTYKLYDWFDSTNVDNVRKEGNWWRYTKDQKYDHNGEAPYLQSATIKADPTRLLKSITFKLDGCYNSSDVYQNKTVYCGVFAVTGAVSANAPATPTISNANDITSNSFTANWSSISNATGYYLDVATDAGFNNMVNNYNNKQIVGNVTSYSVTGLNTDVTYYYRVRAYNNSGSSITSGVMSATTAFTPLEQPQVTYDTDTQTFRWDAIAHAGKYAWTLSVDGKTLQTGENDAASCTLPVSDDLNQTGTYTLTVTARASDAEAHIYSDSTGSQQMKINLPEVVSKATDNVPQDCGIGGTTSTTIEKGVVTVTATPYNSYSDFYGWNQCGEDASEETTYTLQAKENYDALTAYFGVYKEKITSTYDPESDSYTLTLQDDITLENSLQFSDDVILDLNNKKLTATADNTIGVKDANLEIKSGQLDTSAASDSGVISTQGNGSVVIDKSAQMTGTVSGDVEATWKEADGSTHYTTFSDAMESQNKKAEPDSSVTVIKDINVNDDLTIDSDIRVTIPEDVTISVAPNATLTNNGNLQTKGTVQNEGTIANTENAKWNNVGSVTNSGTIRTDGKLENSKGSIGNLGTITGTTEIANENGTIDTKQGTLETPVDNGFKGEVKSETTWSEGDKQHFGSLSQAVENATEKSNQDITITIQEDAQVESDITIPENATLFVPADTTLTIPENTKLTNQGNIVESGTLDVKGTLGTQAGWTEGSTNYYGTLQDALDNVKPDETITLKETTTWDKDQALDIPDDVTLKIEEDVVLVLPEDATIHNEENIRSDSSWNNASGTNYGALKDALKDAQATEENVDIVLRDDVTVKDDLQIPENATVQIPEDASLTISNGTTLTNNGNIEATGDLNAQGDLKTEAGWSDGKTDYFGKFDQALADAKDETKDITDITILGDVELTDNTTIPEDTTIKIAPEGSLTIPEDTTLTNNGTLENEGTLTNNGSVKNDQKISNTGKVEGTGTIRNAEGEIDTDGGVIKNKIVDADGAESSENITSEAAWTKDGSTYYGSLEKVLEEAEDGAVITIFKDAAITKDTTVREGVTLNVGEDINLTIAEDVTFTNNGTIANEGVLTNQGSIVGKGQIQNKGTIDSSNGNVQNTINNSEGGQITSPVTWVKDGKTCYGTLEGALADGAAEITLLGDVTLTDDVTIPDGVTVVIPEGKTLTVPEGKTLTNQGTIQNDGTLANGGTLDLTDGVLCGEVENTSTGSVKSDVTWTVDGKTYHGSLEEALAKAAQNPEETIEILPEAKPLVIRKDITIPANASLVIPKDGSVQVNHDVTVTNNGEIINNGKIANNGTLAGTGSLANKAGATLDSTDGIIRQPLTNDADGVVKSEATWVDGEGKTCYGSLKEGIAEVEENGGTVTVNTPNLEIRGEVTIPENVTVEIPEDSTVTVVDGGSLINNGNVVAEGNLKTNGSGRLNTEAAWTDTDGKTHYGSLSDALDAMEPAEGSASTVEKITIMGDHVSAPADKTITIPESVEMVVAPGATLDIPSNSTIENNGIFSNEGTIANAGRITNKGQMNNAGLVSGDGYLDTTDGTLDSAAGMIENTVESGEKEPETVNATLTTADGKIYTGGLDGLLKNAKAGDQISLIKDTNLTEDVVIPKDVTLVVPADKTLSVSKDAKLTNRGTIENAGTLENNGGTVTNAGTITGDGTIANKNHGTLDLTEGVSENDVTNDLFSETKSEASWTIGGKTYRGSLDEALKAAEKSEEQVTITVEGNPVTIDNTVKIPANATLEIPKKASVVIAEGGSLTNLGKIEAKGELTTTEGGKLNTEASWTDKKGVTHFGTLEDALEEAEAGTADNISIIGENVTWPSGKNEIPENVTVTVGESTTVSIPDDVTLVNNGNLVNNGKLANNGTITNNGDFRNETGELTGNPATNTEQGTSTPMVKRETETRDVIYSGLDNALKNAKPGDKILLQEDIVAEGDLNIPEDVTLVVPADKTLTIPKGTTVTNHGTIENDGEISNAGTVDNVKNASIRGENPISNTGDGKVASDAIWERDGKTYYGSVEDGIADLEKNNGGTLTINKDEATISNDITIPDNVNVVVPAGSKLTVEPGVTITNAGTIENQGTIDNGGSILGSGNIANESGTIENNGGMIGTNVENGENGNIQAEASWTLRGKTYYGTLEDALNAMKTQLNGTITISNDVTISGDVTIPSGVQLEIKDPAVVTIDKNATLRNNGTLINGGTIRCDGVLENNSRIEGTGTIATETKWNDGSKDCYGPLQEAVKKAPAGSTITVVSNVTVSDNVTIPEDVTLYIPEDKTVTIGKGGSITNLGTITGNGQIKKEETTGGGSTSGGSTGGSTGGSSSGSTGGSAGGSSSGLTGGASGDLSGAASGTVGNNAAGIASNTGSTNNRTSQASGKHSKASKKNTAGNSANGAAQNADVSDAVDGDNTSSSDNSSSGDVTENGVAQIPYEQAKDTLVDKNLQVKYGDGNILISVETLDESGNVDAKLYGSVILTSADNVIRACLTDEELQRVKAGENLKIRLTVKAMPAQASDEEQEQILAQIAELGKDANWKNLKLGQYLDITLERKFGSDEAWERLRELNEELEICIDIPEDLQYADASYYVMRLHDGETTLLDDLDEDAQTITICTALFSTYAILYTQPTSHNWVIWILLLLLLLCVVSALYIKNRKKKHTN